MYHTTIPFMVMLISSLEFEGFNRNIRNQSISLRLIKFKEFTIIYKKLKQLFNYLSLSNILLNISELKSHIISI